MNIYYKIKDITQFKLLLKDLFGNEKRYYKIQNNTSKTLTIYKVIKSIKIKQDYKKIARKLKKSTDSKISLNTTATFHQKIKKIVLKPYTKIKIHYERLLPLYWIEENTLFPIEGFRTYSKIIFTEREEEHEVEEDKEEIEELEKRK